MPGGGTLRVSTVSAVYQSLSRQHARTDSLTSNLHPTSQAHFVGTLDYLWYTMDRLSVGGLLEMVDDRLVQEHSALPSPLFSSDHVPLLAEFHFKR